MTYYDSANHSVSPWNFDPIYTATRPAVPQGKCQEILGFQAATAMENHHFL